MLQGSFFRQTGTVVQFFLLLIGINAGCTAGVAQGVRNGNPVLQNHSEYHVQYLLPRRSLLNSTIRLKISKEGDGLPVTMPLASLEDALRTELHNAGATVITDVGTAFDRADLDFEVLLSKFQSQRFRHGAKAFINGVGIVRVSFTKQEIARITFGLSGLGPDPARAEEQMLERWTARLLKDRQLTSYLAGAEFQNGSSALTLELDQLTAGLFRKTQKLLGEKQDGRVRRIAVGRIIIPNASPDEAEAWAERVQVSCSCTWDSSFFSFYARTRLKDLLEEFALQQSGALDQKTSTKIGEMHGIEYLVLGTMHTGKGGDGIELSVYELSTGSMVAAERGHLTTTQLSNGRKTQ